MLRLLFCLFLIVSAMTMFGQDSLFYRADGTPTDRQQATYYKITTRTFSSNRFVEKTYYPNHNIRSIQYFKSNKRLVKVDTSKSFYKDGSLDCSTAYNNQGQVLSLKQWYPNGQVKRIEYYAKGQFLKGKKYNENGRRIQFTRYNQPPKYNGGYERMIEYLNRTIQYPEQANALNIRGIVIVSFIVTKNGKVRQARIEQSVHPLLDQEALRVVRIMKQWMAGKTNDEKVNTRISIPISFGKPDAADHIPRNN